MLTTFIIILSSCVIKIQQLFLRPTTSLTSTFPETGVGVETTANIGCPTAYRAFRGTKELQIIHFDHPSHDRPMLLNFRDHTPKRTDRGDIELLESIIPWLMIDFLLS
jgi:hypothetical protein